MASINQGVADVELEGDEDTAVSTDEVLEIDFGGSGGFFEKVVCVTAAEWSTYVVQSELVGFRPSNVSTNQRGLEEEKMNSVFSKWWVCLCFVVL